MLNKKKPLQADAKLQKLIFHKNRGFYKEKKLLRAGIKAQQLVIFVVLDMKWVAMAPFGLKLGQNESTRHQEGF